MGELYAAGNTRALLEFLTHLYAEDPSDARIKNNLAIICLLRKSDLDKAYELAEAAFDSSPKNPFFISRAGASGKKQLRLDATRPQ